MCRSAGLGGGAWLTRCCQALTPLYLSEIAPKKLRGLCVTFNQISMTGGIMVAFWVAYAVRNVPHGWQWAIAGQILPATVLLLMLIALPRSPRWLVQRGHAALAKDVLLSLRGSDDAEAELREIVQASRVEDSRAPWADYLRDPLIRRRVFITVGLQSFQTLTGINVRGGAQRRGCGPGGAHAPPPR